MTKYHIFTNNGEFFITTEEFEKAKEYIKKGYRTIIMTKAFSAELSDKPFKK